MKVLSDTIYDVEIRPVNEHASVMLIMDAADVGAFLRCPKNCWAEQGWTIVQERGRLHFGIKVDQDKMYDIEELALRHGFALTNDGAKRVMSAV